NEVVYKIDVNTLEKSKVDRLALNEIGRITLTSNKTLFFDPYSKNKGVGSFVLIDSVTNNTVAVGMMIGKGKEGDAALGDGKGRTLWVDDTLQGDKARQTLMLDGNTVIRIEGETYGTPSNIAAFAHLLNDNNIDVVVVKPISAKEKKELGF
ncbi:MAG: hypothetical protein RR908_05505, partial [Rikenellaceae bacterium]